MEVVAVSDRTAQKPRGQDQPEVGDDHQLRLGLPEELIARFPFSALADDAQYAIGRIYEIELGNLVQAKLEYEALIARYPTSEFLALAHQGLTRIARR